MAVTFVQSASDPSGAADFASPTTPGNCVVAFLQAYGASAIGGVVSGASSADRWASAVEVDGAGQVAAIWLDPGCEGGDTAMSFTAAGATQQNIQVMEFAGAGNAPVLDVPAATNLVTTTPNSTAWTSGATAAATSAADLWLGLYASNDGSLYSATEPGSPWNCPESVTTQNVSHEYTRMTGGYQIPAATGTVTFSGIASTNSSVYAAIAIALTPGSSSGGSGLLLAFPC